MLPLLTTAFVFGFRHGFDWDHIVAIFDLTTSGSSRGRSIFLSLLYALGHAGMVVVLGMVAVAAGAVITGGAADVMQRVVGATLVAMGIYVIISLARHGSGFQVGSRWVMLGRGAYRLLRAIHTSRTDDEATAAHVHPHPVHLPHDHGHERGALAPRSMKLPLPLQLHEHPHSHDLGRASDRGRFYEAVAAVGVGAIHGIGAETPTQIVVFVAALGASGAAEGVAVLVAFAAGLVASNVALATASAFGAVQSMTRPRIYVTIVLTMAVFSIGTGLLFVFGRGGVLPEI